GRRRHHALRRPERTRSHVPPELVGDEGEVDQAPPADAAATLLLRHEQRRPPESRAPLPPVALEPIRVFGQLADPGHRALGLEEAPRRVLEHLLVRTQLQFHVTSLVPRLRYRWPRCAA